MDPYGRMDHIGEEKEMHVRKLCLFAVSKSQGVITALKKGAWSWDHDDRLMSW